VRRNVIAMGDEQRSMAELVGAITHSYDGDPIRRIIYTESHDEVANGSARVPAEIEPGNETGWPSQKRSTLGAALVMTSPGIPMIFQGQEVLEGGWFSDSDPLDWQRADAFSGIARLYQDLINLRLNRAQNTRGLTGRGVNAFHVNEDSNVIAFHRWLDGGPGDDVVVVLNLANEEKLDYRIGFPREGLWKLRFNSDATLYSSLFGDFDSFDADATAAGADGLPVSATVNVGPYSVLIYSQDM